MLARFRFCPRLVTIRDGHLPCRFPARGGVHALCDDRPEDVEHFDPMTLQTALPANSALIPADALRAGTRLEDYEIDCVVARSAVAMVYRAQDRRSKQAVAIKEFLPTGLAMRGDDGQVVARESSSRAQLPAWAAGLPRGGEGSGHLRPRLSDACTARPGMSWHRLQGDALLPRVNPARAPAERCLQRQRSGCCARGSKACWARWRYGTRPAGCMVPCRPEIS